MSACWRVPLSVYVSVSVSVRVRVLSPTGSCLAFSPAAVVAQQLVRLLEPQLYAGEPR